MSFYDVVKLIGGLALFLYGMQALGDSLVTASGSKFQSLLERMTSNPVRAVLLGTGVTAVIQSSSATTVMVVGLVNAGLLTLSQSVGIIMGANIGTTLTAWLLSLGTIGDSSVYLSFLKPAFFSPILAAIAVAILLFSKDEKRRNISRVIIGFVILMYGMEEMTGAVKPLSQLPEFQKLFLTFSNPFIGLLIGAGLTAIIQSSSASIGILQALSTTGIVTFGSAIPIVFGQNIGTCVTAMISSIGTSRDAKRAALVHLFFNIFGTMLFMGTFYILNTIFGFTFLTMRVTPVDIAIANTLYKTSATIVQLPFRHYLVRFVKLILPDEEKEPLLDLQDSEQRFASLDPRFLDNPSFALVQCSQMSNEMAELVERQYNLAVRQLHAFSRSDFKHVKNAEGIVDQYEDNLGTYMVKLSGSKLTDSDSRILSLLLKCLGDYERISDHAFSIALSGKEMYDKKIDFSREATNELAVMESAVSALLEMTVRAFRENDVELARRVEPLEEVIDYLTDELQARHIQRLQDNRCTLELGFIFMDVLTAMERVADHCSNIAISILELAHGPALDQHAHLHSLKVRADFTQQVREFEEMYRLPTVERPSLVQQLALEDLTDSSVS
ncbi:MAG: Na/Pi cotransporter family protein [Saccharofermentanales bacterium]|jgi:phosphate:Na+ symporter|nr:Na/Pi cotransporter family protein [Clostridiaceae bacterium]